MPGTGNSGGRNKIATSAHIVRGTFRDERHGDHSTPEPPKGQPVPPKPLEGDALEEWQRMVGRLESCGTLATVEDASIYQYCQLFAEAEMKAARVSEYGEAIALLESNLRDLKGAELVSCFQEITKMHQLREHAESKVLAMRMGLRQWLVEFGLTPAARSRVKLPPKKAESKVDQFRNAKAGA